MRVLLILVVAACSKSAPKSGEPPLGGWYASKHGVFLDKKLVVPADMLTRPGALKAVLGKTAPPTFMVVDLDDEPVAVLQTLLRDLDGLEIALARRDATARKGASDSCGVRISTKPIATRPTLSIDVLDDRVFVGHVPVNEYQQIMTRDADGTAEHDWMKLETTLEQHKESGAFAQRADIELAVTPSLTSGTMLQAVHSACLAYFTEISVLPREELSAKATLDEVVDVGSAKTVSDVIAALRAYEGKEHISLRANKKIVCDGMKLVAPTKKPVKPPAGSGYFVALVRNSGAVWIAMKQTMDPKAEKTGEFTDKVEEIPEPYSGTFNNMRLFTHIKKAPLELAAEDGVDVPKYLAAIRSACDAGLRTEQYELRAPGELSIRPQ